MVTTRRKQRNPQPSRPDQPGPSNQYYQESPELKRSRPQRFDHLHGTGPFDFLAPLTARMEVNPALTAFGWDPSDARACARATLSLIAQLIMQHRLGDSSLRDHTCFTSYTVDSKGRPACMLLSKDPLELRRHSAFLSTNGYVNIKMGHGSGSGRKLIMIGAHRLVVWALYGLAPKQMALHSCPGHGLRGSERKRCVHPAHLRAGGPAANRTDAVVLSLAKRGVWQHKREEALAQHTAFR